MRLRWLNCWGQPHVFQRLFRCNRRNLLSFPSHSILLVMGLIVSLISATSSTAARPMAPPPEWAQQSTGSFIKNVAVFGKDTRKRLTRKQKHLASKIGLLYDRQGRYVCTAFCVAPNMVATAAHCLSTSEKNRNTRLNRFLFSLTQSSKNRPARIAGAREGLAALNVTTGADRLRLRPPIDASRDWAFVRLSKNTCRFGHFKLSNKSPAEIRKLARRNKVYQVAYHRDFGDWQLAYSRACPVERSFKGTTWRTVKREFQRAERLLLHKCDTAGASSGSPLLIDGPDGPEAVAINVGTYLRAKMLMQNGQVLKKLNSKTIANTAVHAAPLRQALADFQSAPPLSRTTELRELQQRLFEAGFYRGRIDGLYGPRTRVSIEDYQRIMSLPVTGLATKSLLKRLRSQGMSAQSDQPKKRLDEKQTSWQAGHQPTWFQKKQTIGED